MKIVITGGTGLIGRELVKNLTGGGHDVVILTRAPEKYKAAFSAPVDLVKWNGRDVGAWAEHLEDADAVVNLAGESISGEGFIPDRWTAEKKRRIVESRVAVGQALVNGFEGAVNKPAVMIQASAVGYYGATGDQVITEESDPGSDFLASVTQAWEASTAAVENMGVRRVIARIGLVLSTEDGALPRLLLPSNLFAGGWFGSGEQWWSWIHITDTAEALQFLIENELARGPVNVVSPNPETNKEFGKALGRAMNRPALIPVPGFALRLALGEVATTVLDGQRVTPQQLLELGYEFQFANLDGALENLIQGTTQTARNNNPVPA